MNQKVIDEKRCACGFSLSGIVVTTKEDGSRSMTGYTTWFCPVCHPIKVQIGSASDTDASDVSSVARTGPNVQEDK